MPVVSCCVQTIYIRKTMYFAYANYVLYKVGLYTFAYVKIYTCAKHTVLHMQKYMVCITYEKLYILNKKQRAFHDEAPTTKINIDTAFVFAYDDMYLSFLKCYMLRRGLLGFTNAV